MCYMVPFGTYLARLLLLLTTGRLPLEGLWERGVPTSLAPTAPLDYLPGLVGTHNPSWVTTEANLNRLAAKSPALLYPTDI